ncbi:MAG: o-succinylbenzoate--CoA ligase [Bacillus sp. (in: firmicutes)]
MYKSVLPNWLQKRVELTPERPAIYLEGKEWTFRQLYEEAAGLGHILSIKGIGHGDRVGILQSNSWEMVCAIHACMLIGAEMVLFNVRLTSSELSWQVVDSEVKVMLVGNRLAASLPVETERWVIEELMGIRDGKRVNPVPEVDMGTTATIMYTSGTSGHPKAVRQTYGNHWWSAVGSMLNLGLRETDKWLCAVPLFHISGLSILIRSVIYGIPVVLHRQFSEEDMNKAIQEQEVTIASVVTTMLNRMIQSLGDNRYPDTFRCMLLGGGPAPLSVLEVCGKKQIPVFQTYGMTETASQIATLSPEDSLRKLGSAGKPLFPVQLKIAAEAGREADCNESGEILVKGPNVTAGYINNEKIFKDSLDAAGYFKTGDIGYLDEEGFLYVLDRRSDLIISGGENIYPAEIEAVLTKHPAVFEAGVTGFEDAHWGQVPVAFLVAHEGWQKSTEEIMEHCRQHLAAYKIPKQIVFVDELPRNASNKLMRRKLKQLCRYNG